MICAERDAGPDSAESWGVVSIRRIVVCDGRGGCKEGRINRRLFLDGKINEHSTTEAVGGSEGGTDRDATVVLLGGPRLKGEDAARYLGRGREKRDPRPTNR